MKIRNLDVGVERITNWAVEDEVHLPAEARVAPAFLPQERALDAILQRPSLDERLPGLLAPTSLDPVLLEPAALTDTRLALGRYFRDRAVASGFGEDAEAFAAAAEVLAADQNLDNDVRSALAMLLKG